MTSVIKYECDECCVRGVPQSYHRQKPPLHRCVLAFLLWPESFLSRLAELVLRWPGITLIVATMIVMIVPGSEHQAESTVTLSIEAKDKVRTSVVLRADDPAKAPSLADKAWKRLSSRWALLVTIAGLASLCKVLRDVVRGQSRYLNQDIQIDPIRSTDSRVGITAIVENKLDDDEKIFNAILLVGHSRYRAEELLEQLEHASPIVAGRIYCGRNLDTWGIRKATCAAGVDLKVNTGFSIQPMSQAEQRVEALLCACPLPSTRLETENGADYCSIEPIRFFTEENDAIANERITFPLSFETAKFARGEMYVVRLYLIGEATLEERDIGSRCTARGFVVPTS